MSAVDTALVEVLAAVKSQALAHEGLRDYARLNIKEGTLAVVNLEIARYDRRLALLTAANNALVDLVNDGYPKLDAAEIPQEALADLKENASTVEAALARFVGNTAASLSLTSGEAEAKA